MVSARPDNITNIHFAHSLRKVLLDVCILEKLYRATSSAQDTHGWEHLILTSVPLHAYGLVLTHAGKASAEDLRRAPQAKSRSHGHLVSAAVACVYMSMLTQCDRIDWSGDGFAPEYILKTPDILETCASARYSFRICIARYGLASDDAQLPAVHGPQRQSSPHTGRSRAEIPTWPRQAMHWAIAWLKYTVRRLRTTRTSRLPAVHHQSR